MGKVFGDLSICLPLAFQWRESMPQYTAVSISISTFSTGLSGSDTWHRMRKCAARREYTFVGWGRSW